MFPKVLTIVCLLIVAATCSQTSSQQLAKKIESFPDYKRFMNTLVAFATVNRIPDPESVRSVLEVFSGAKPKESVGYNIQYIAAKTNRGEDVLVLTDKNKSRSWKVKIEFDRSVPFLSGSVLNDNGGLVGTCTYPKDPNSNHV